MSIFKCKMCGGDLSVTEGMKIVECEYCGTTQTVPDANDEKKTNLFNRANRLRMECEFDKAAGVYEGIVSEFPEEAEGYWGLVLCAYGIEYVDDPKTGRKVPTCHRTVTTSVMDDKNFELACENSDLLAKNIYREEAKEIDRLQKSIFAIVEKEEPYDVFICYKETDDISKKRTEDSQIAQDIYTELIKEGYKVFFSRITLREKAGTEYEPYIYAALSSAKVMLAIGTKYDYYDAVWVKNEWSRYLDMMSRDNAKHLIPCYKNLDAYDIPKEFNNLQAIDMGEVTFFKNLTSNVERFIPRNTVTQTVNVTDTNTDALLKRAFMFLEDGEWKSADEYCEKVLDINPECAVAYLGKLMAELRVRKKEDLKDCEQPFDGRNDYEKIMRFGDEKLKFELAGYTEYVIEKIKKQIEQKRIELEKKLSEFPTILEEFKIRNSQISISAGGSHTVGLKEDGTVVATNYFGDYYIGQCDVSGWSDIVAVSAGGSHTVGLKSDGTVVATKYIGNMSNYDGQCDVSDWSDIVAVSAGYDHTVGLKTDGTVVATKGYGEYCYGKYEVSDWSDIVAVSAGYDHTVGLKSDGTVVATNYFGDYYRGQCDVSEWTDIVAISAGGSHTVGLKSDGTVVATKYIGPMCDYYGQCDVSEWSDIVAVSAGPIHTIGLKSDGTVVATKFIVEDDYDGQCDVSDWEDIVAISAGSNHTVGLKSDGTVVATKFIVEDNYDGQCDVYGWTEIATPIFAKTKDEYYGKKKQRDEMITMRKKDSKYDNACELMGSNDLDKCLMAMSMFEEIGGWKDSDEKVSECAKIIEEMKEQERIKKAQREEQKRIEREKRAEAERARLAEEKRQEEIRLKEQKERQEKYRNAGLCQHCGGELKGLFSKKCVNCSKPKDY